jgi:hypothetical protein
MLRIKPSLHCELLIAALISVFPLSGQSPEWSEKFRGGARAWRDMLRRAHKVGGDSALLTALQKSLKDNPNYW